MPRGTPLRAFRCVLLHIPRAPQAMWITQFFRSDVCFQAAYGAPMPGSGAKPAGKASPTGDASKDLSPMEQVDKAVGIIVKQKIGVRGKESTWARWKRKPRG